MAEFPEQHKHTALIVLGVGGGIALLVYLSKKSGQAQVIQPSANSQDNSVALAQIQAGVANKQLAVQALNPLAQLFLGQRQIDAQQNIAQIQSAHDIAIGQLQAGVAESQLGTQQAIQLGTIASQTQLGLSAISGQEYQTQLAAQTQQQQQGFQFQLGSQALTLQGFIAQLNADLQHALGKWNFRLGQQSLGVQQALGSQQISAGQTVQLDAINKQAEVQNRASLFGFLGNILSGLGGLAGGFAF